MGLRVWMSVLVFVAATRCERPAAGTAAEPEVPVPAAGRVSLGRGVFGAGPRSIAVGHCDDDDILDALSVGGDNTGLAPLATEAPAPAVFLGRGDGSFRELPNLGLPSRRYSTGLFADLDGDGDDDVVMAHDDVLLLKNLGGCRFDAPQVLLSGLPRRVFSVLPADVDLDGVTDLVLALAGPLEDPYRVLRGLGNGSFAAETIGAEKSTSGDGEVIPFALFHDDADGDGVMDRLALVDRGEAWIAWGNTDGGPWRRDLALSGSFAAADPMSVSPLDADGDGAMDYFVAGLPMLSRLLLGGDRALRNIAFTADVAGSDESTAWGSWAFDADLDGTTDLLALRVGDGKQDFPAGPVELYLGHRDGTFDAARARSLGISLRAKAMACGDLSGRGDRGCLVMTDADVALLRDTIAPRGRWAGLRLRGTLSAPDATGARVVLPAAGPRAHYYGPQCPYGAAHDRRLLVAIGDRDVAELEVRWPSGLRQRVSVAAGRYTTVVEPAVLSLSARAAPADGMSAVEVCVNASAAGATRATLRLDGAGTLRESNGRCAWVVVAPSAPGEATLTLSLDGAALQVRPRLRFTPP